MRAVSRYAMRNCSLCHPFKEVLQTLSPAIPREMGSGAVWAVSTFPRKTSIALNKILIHVIASSSRHVSSHNPTKKVNNFISFLRHNCIESIHAVEGGWVRMLGFYMHIYRSLGHELTSHLPCMWACQCCQSASLVAKIGVDPWIAIVFLRHQDGQNRTFQ